MRKAANSSEKKCQFGMLRQHGREFKTVVPYAMQCNPNKVEI